MDSILYVICQILVVFIALSLIALTTYGLRRAFLAMRKDIDQQNQIIKWVFWGITSWLIVLFMLSLMGFFSKEDDLSARVLTVGLFPPFLLIIVLLCSSSFSNLLRYIPPKWLIQVQSFRTLMELVLWLGFMGSFVPFQMTFVGFNMDIIAGITAGFAGAIFLGKKRYLKPETVIWNIFGIFLLLNILFVVVISTPSPFQIFKNEPTNIFLSKTPFIWIPGFIVPYALAMHLFSLKQVLILKGK